MEKTSCLPYTLLIAYENESDKNENNQIMLLRATITNMMVNG